MRHLFAQKCIWRVGDMGNVLPYPASAFNTSRFATGIKRSVPIINVTKKTRLRRQHEASHTSRLAERGLYSNPGIRVRVHPPDLDAVAHPRFRPDGGAGVIDNHRACLGQQVAMLPGQHQITSDQRVHVGGVAAIALHVAGGVVPIHLLT